MMYSDEWRIGLAGSRGGGEATACRQTELLVQRPWELDSALGGPPVPGGSSRHAGSRLPRQITAPRGTTACRPAIRRRTNQLSHRRRRIVSCKRRGRRRAPSHACPRAPQRWSGQMLVGVLSWRLCAQMDQLFVVRVQRIYSGGRNTEWTVWNGCGRSILIMVVRLIVGNGAVLQWIRPTA